MLEREARCEVMRFHKSLPQMHDHYYRQFGSVLNRISGHDDGESPIPNHFKFTYIILYFIIIREKMKILTF